MNEDEVLKTIREIVADQMDDEVQDLPDSTSLLPVGMDDLDRVEIANELEKAFDIELPYEEHSLWQTMGDIYSSVKNALQMQKASVSQ